MPAPVVTCGLVAALALGFGGETTAAVIVAAFCGVIEFFLPSWSADDTENVE
jgi:hypothetical protein